MTGGFFTLSKGYLIQHKCVLHVCIFSSLMNIQ